MLTKGKFLVSFEVPGHTKDYTEEFTEEMVIPYRTEELNPYLRYPNQEINKNHLHSEFIRLRLREILQINNHNRYNPTTMNITYLKVILSLITILILIHNENTYQSPPTNKIRYIISQTLILIIYTTLMILIQRYL